ncbi:UNVERIFIED_CONTAM: Cytoplasmic FMR1-interacting protein 2 [Siphonaria sp. JEL0065]|nr:Cytoplasmic FMR1-interacting protein 2 [Siphonaria sp. JEL0065]
MKSGLSQAEIGMVAKQYSLVTHMESLSFDYGQFEAKYISTLTEIDFVSKSKLLRMNKDVASLDTRTDYELAIRCNYSDEDKKALIKALAIAKDTSTRLHLTTVQISILKKHIHYETQRFLLINCTEYISSCQKRKRSIVGVLGLLNGICADKSIPNCESILHKFDESIFSDFVFNGACGATTISQLKALSVILEFCSSDKSKGMKGGFLKDKDLKETQVMEIREVLRKIQSWVQVLDLYDNVGSKNVGLAPLSNLWFKEFYLEVSQQVQFPVNTSLPWILTEYILEINEPDLLQLVLYPFEIYSSASGRILQEFKCRYIHDELTAEVLALLNRYFVTISL